MMVTLGTDELKRVANMMTKYRDLALLAAQNGIRLNEQDERDMLELTEWFHRTIYQLPNPVSKELLEQGGTRRR